MSTTIISVNNLRQGVVLPTSVYDARMTQVLLLNRGVVLTKEILVGLKRRGVSRISVDSKFASTIATSLEETHQKLSSRQKQFQKESLLKNVSKTEALANNLKRPNSPEYDGQLEFDINSTKQKHSENLNEYLEELKNETKIVSNSKPLSEITHESIELLLGDIDLFVKLAIESSQTPHSNEHCLKTANLSMSIATVLGFDADSVGRIGAGCLLSRIGITDEIQVLVNSPREFTMLESLEMKKHASKKLRLLEQIPGLHLGSKQVAWQIHERWNGTGYPRGRCGTQIPPLVRIASVADAFVALTSDRPHRRAYAPYQAINIMLEETKKGSFEPNAIRGLLRTVCLFPLGSFVELSDHSFATTIRNHPKTYDKPTVKVICDSFGFSHQTKVIDLSNETELHIIRSLDASELNAFLKSREEQDHILEEALADFSDLEDSTL